MIIQALIWALWPGKFPRTSCFWGYDTYRFVWVWEGAYGFLWKHWGAGTRVERKNNLKRSKSGRVSLILWCMSGRKKPGSWQGWLRWSDRIIWGKYRQKKGCGAIWCVYSKRSDGKIYVVMQKNIKTSKFKLIQTKQNKQKNNRTKWAKKSTKKDETTQKEHHSTV